MKKLTKKQQIRLSIIGGVLVLAVLIGVTVLNNRPKDCRSRKYLPDYQGRRSRAVTV